MDGHGGGEHGIGNAIRMDMLARWRIRGGREQLQGGGTILQTI